MTVEKAPSKAAVTVSEMARMCDLSRSRFYHLIERGVFPVPVQNESVKRPYYDHELQTKCLEIRQTGIGSNGKPILFNRKPAAPRASERPKPATKTGDKQHSDLVEAIKGLGIAVTNDAVTSALAEVFPEGTVGVEQGEIIRAVFLHLKSKK